MSYHWKQYGLINHIYVQSLHRLIPKVNDGLMINGNGWLSVMIFTSSSEWTMALFGIPTPILFIACQNNFRFSALFIGSMETPRSSTPYFFNTPCSWSLIAILRAVCPPMVGKIESGFSFSMIDSSVLIMGSINIPSTSPRPVMRQDYYLLKHPFSPLP